MIYQMKIINFLRSLGIIQTSIFFFKILAFICYYFYQLYLRLYFYFYLWTCFIFGISTLLFWTL